LLAKKSKIAMKKHHPALPYAAIGDFMARLRAREGVQARALEFTILTAVRTGEAIGARWEEIDVAAKVWTVPASRMKAGVEHRVPLADRVMEILEQLPREGDFVFIGGAQGKPLGNVAMLKVLRAIDGDGTTVHGFRSSFRDWASEQTAYARETCESALAHAIGDATEAAYRRGDALEKRRRLMADWADFCGQPSAAPGTAAGKVVPLRKLA
jgi:integrase